METTIIHKALEVIGETLPFKTNWNTHLPGKLKDAGFDGKLELCLGKEKIHFFVIVKKEIRFHQLALLFDMKKEQEHIILFADTIFPKIKEELRNKNIAYIDGAGNMCLKTNLHFIWIDQNKKQTNNKEDQKNRAFTKTGLKVIFNFLLNENMINATYREIAAENKIAIGNIKYIIDGLEQIGCLAKLDKKTFKFTNKKTLLERWMNEYEAKLKPTLFIGNYRFLKNEDFKNWKKIQLKNKVTQWGGEPAADLLTNYLNPEILTIYTTEQKNEIIKNYRLIPDNTGNVKVYKKFWNYNEVNENVVPPVLIYTDLINTGNARNIETANMIYNELLKDRY